MAEENYFWNDCEVLDQTQRAVTHPTASFKYFVSEEHNSITGDISRYVMCYASTIKDAVEFFINEVGNDYKLSFDGQSLRFMKYKESTVTEDMSALSIEEDAEPVYQQVTYWSNITLEVPEGELLSYLKNTKTEIH